MNLAFDLISDLHVETWPEFDWQHQATSPFCVVAGDVARDPEILKETLTHLGQCYKAVFYIDGNDEHRWFYNDLESSYRDLKLTVKDINNVVYLQDNVAIINGVAILGANGWWTWDFDPSITKADAQTWFMDYVSCSPMTPEIVTGFAESDAVYLRQSVAKLQKHQDVKKIIIVTHTLPNSRFIDHDISLLGNYRYNCMGNNLLQQALLSDTEHKISHWCFGHYHGGNIDQIIDGIRYVNNYRGRGDTSWSKSVYYPKRIEVTI